MRRRLPGGSALRRCRRCPGAILCQGRRKQTQTRTCIIAVLRDRLTNCQNWCRIWARMMKLYSPISASADWTSRCHSCLKVGQCTSAVTTPHSVDHSLWIPTARLPGTSRPLWPCRWTKTRNISPGNSWTGTWREKVFQKMTMIGGSNRILLTKMNLGGQLKMGEMEGCGKLGKSSSFHAGNPPHQMNNLQQAELQDHHSLLLFITYSHQHLLNISQSTINLFLTNCVCWECCSNS